MAETTATDREALGRIVRETWVKWAKEQSNPKGHWIVTWDALDAGQREVDMRIGEAVQAAALARERQRVTVLRTALEIVLHAGDAVYNSYPGGPADEHIERVIDTAADALAADAPEGEQS